MKGYRAFLLGTARDQLPVRGVWVTGLPTFQRRDDVEQAAADTGVMSPPDNNGRCEHSNGHQL